MSISALTAAFIILAYSTPGTVALQRETRTIPIVFVNVNDPVASSIVPRVDRPSGNITGLDLKLNSRLFRIATIWILLLATAWVAEPYLVKPVLALHDAAIGIGEVLKRTDSPPKACLYRAATAPLSCRFCVRRSASPSRHGVGTPVFAAMIAASAVGIFVIPMLYVVFQKLREHSGSRALRYKWPKFKRMSFK